MLRVRKRPVFLGPPVVGSIDNTTEIIRRAVFGHLDGTHRDLIADAASNDGANNVIARLNDPILKHDLTTAVAIGPAAEPSLNR